MKVLAGFLILTHFEIALAGKSVVFRKCSGVFPDFAFESYRPSEIIYSFRELAHSH